MVEQNGELGPFLLTGFNFNLSVYNMSNKVFGEITYPIPNFKGATYKVGNV